MSDAESFSRRTGRERAWLAALIFFLTIIVADRFAVLAAEPDIRKGVQPVTGQQLPPGRQQNPAQQVVAKQQAQPRNPVKIKLHHNAKGDCAWDLAGENVEEILRIDRRLRKAFESTEEAQKI